MRHALRPTPGPYARPTSAILVLGLAAALAGPALADEYEDPPFFADAVQLEAAALPDGWRIVEASEARKPDAAVEAQVRACAKEAGLDLRDDMDIVTTLLADPKGAFVTVVLVEVTVDPKGLPASLQAAAREKGWAYRELASRGRLALLAGPAEARDAALGIQVAWAVRALTEKAFRLVQGAMPRAEEALALARWTFAIEPAAAMPHMIEGTLEARRGAAVQTEEQRAALARGIVLLDKANAEGSPHRPAGMLLTHWYGELGNALLFQKNAAADARARDLLSKALAAGKTALDATHLIIWRYNLACAHSRLREADAAFRELDACLADYARNPFLGPLADWIRVQVIPDPDFDPIRQDPRFDALMSKHGGAPKEGV
jgi:hypothetical protein